MSIVAVFLLTALAGSTGCVTRRELKPDTAIGESRLFVTRSGETVTLSWDSRPDFSYTVFYSTSRDSHPAWRVVTGLDHIRGTGRTLTYQDRVPVNQPRYYRLSGQPAVGLSR